MLNCLNSTAPVYLTELTVYKTAYKTAHQLLCSSNTSFLCLPFVHTHSLGLFGTASSAKLDQTHIVLIIFEISPLQVVLLTLWVCMCILVEVCFDCVLFLVMGK